MEEFPVGIDQKSWLEQALLTSAEMGRADSWTIEKGTPGITLMNNAGQAICDAICDRYQPVLTAVLCGPGNNGGDGFVVARLLAARGWKVRLGLLGEPSMLKGDAAEAASAWTGPVEKLTTELVESAELVVDAVFGAGLTRAPEGLAADVLEACTGKPVVAVDVPSGVDGTDGNALPGALDKADLTVSFFRGKPGHYLLPGREVCGEFRLADIGISPGSLQEIAPRCALNDPTLWADAMPSLTPYSHKFSRGFVLVAGGAEMIGAACLATRAAQRAGAGIVCVTAPVQQGPLYRIALESAVVRSVKDTRGFIEVLSDHRIGCIVIGPGLGVAAPGNHEKVLASLRAGAATVLDADALTLFADAPETLFEQIGEEVLMTPHEGEFARLFPDLSGLPDKVERARIAAKRSGAVVLLKGFDTVVADPKGYAAVNANATPDLATAGAGDVLAGTAAAFIAGGMPVFAAACAATYVHGAAAASKGTGLIASDIPDLLPAVVEKIRLDSKNI